MPEAAQGLTVCKSTVHEPDHWRILGRSWDGSDFVSWFNELFVTSRVVKFLLDHDIRPFSAQPIPVDTTGMSAERLEHLRSMPMLPKT